MKYYYFVKAYETHTEWVVSTRSPFLLMAQDRNSSKTPYHIIFSVEISKKEYEALRSIR